jgi:CubicO group peptidase (beta-lactamase class C family)
MTDTGFFVPSDKAHRFAACYAADGKGGLCSAGRSRDEFIPVPPSMISGGGGLCSTPRTISPSAAHCSMAARLATCACSSPKTIALMTSNHLPGGRDLTDMSKSMFSETSYAGIGFGLGFSVTMNPAKTMIPGSAGEYGWGGAASTAFWIDPAEQLIAIFMTQLLPSSAYPIRRELRTMIYSAITDSNV